MVTTTAALGIKTIPTRTHLQKASDWHFCNASEGLTTEKVLNLQTIKTA